VIFILAYANYDLCCPLVICKSQLPSLSPGVFGIVN